MKKLSYLLIIALPVVLGCEKNQSFEKIDSDIIIRMWETLDSTKRTFQLHCQTEEIYPCYNYGISNTFSVFSERIEIKLDGILVPDICLTALGPARAFLDLETLSEGTYGISILINNSQSTGSLIVDPEYYELNLDIKRQVDLKFDRLNRVPENTIWGRVNYHKSSTEQLAEAFFDSLKVIGAEYRAYRPGDYGYFRIDSDGNKLPPEYPGQKYVKPFIFEYTGEMSDLRTLLKNYRQLYDDLLTISLNTSKGETL